MNIPRVNPVGLVEFPVEYSTTPRSHSIPMRVAATIVLVTFLIVGMATTVSTLGTYCLTSGI